MEEKHISANAILDRIPDHLYIEEWTNLLQKEMVQESRDDDQPVVIFRLNGEWLALHTAVFSEIAHVRAIHRIPHRKSFYLLGLVNLRGRLRLVISLHRLLQLEEEAKTERMVAIQRREEFWIFPADEVYGNVRYKRSELRNVPVTVSKSSANFMRGVITWEGKSVGVLDEELLFQVLSRGI